MNNKKQKDNAKEAVQNEKDPQLNDAATPEAENNSETNIEETPESEAAGNEEESVDQNDAIQVEKEKYVRLYSEFENFRRRTVKERLELMQNASKDVITEMLSVVDDMERGLKAMQNSGDAKSAEGLELIYKKLYSLLEKRGLKPMNAQGTPFDPELHEAVTQFDAPTEDMKGKVIDEIEKGYFLNDKVIRFAKVVVGK